MRNVGADLTVGDAGVSIEVTTNTDLTGCDIEFIFIKPDGSSFTRTATSISVYTAAYVSQADDFDLDGDHYVYLRNKTVQYEFNEGNNRFRVRPKGEDQAVWK